MRPIIHVRDVTKGFVGRPLFSRVSFDLFEGDRVGIVGSNGVGKTTLLKILLKEEPIDIGILEIREELRIGFIPQYQTQDSDRTVGEVLSESPHAEAIRRQLTAIEARMADPAFFESPESAEELRRYGDLQTEMARYGGTGFAAKTWEVLANLGAPDMGPDKRISDLSGGERRKVALAKVLVAAPDLDLLLLDEPTNHLDIQAIEWLEAFLLEYEGTAMIVSHDRYMLDDTVTQIFEFEGGKLRAWPGDYTEFAERKEAWVSAMQRSRGRQQKEIGRQEKFIEKMRGRNRFDAQIRSKLRRLDEMERIEDPVVKEKILKFRFREETKGGRFVAKATNLTKSFGEQLLFQDVNFEVEHGDRIGVVGPNGCGKTTLLKMLTEEEKPSAGVLDLSSAVKTGYFEQGHLHLNPENDLVQEIQEVDVRLHEFDAKALLGRFLFKGAMVTNPVGQLSGGERARLAILKLIMSPINLLILDEPTNHLDLQSQHAVEAALNAFHGTLIVATHDRYFLDSVTTRILAYRGTRIESYPGSYTHFREKVAREEEVDRAAPTTGGHWYIIRRKFTDWRTGKKYAQGERIYIEAEEAESHRWAFESGRLERA